MAVNQVTELGTRSRHRTQHLIRLCMNNARTIAALEKTIAQLTAIKDRLVAADEKAGSSPASAKKSGTKKTAAKKAPVKKRAAKKTAQ